MLERLSVNEFTTHRWTFYKDVIRYASLGVNRIGIWRTKMNDLDREEAVDMLFEMKMKVSSINWAGGFTGADGRNFVDAVDDGVSAVELAAQVGADCLIVHPGALNGHTNSHARRIFKSAVDNLAQVAADYGTRIALEPIPGQRHSPWTFYNRFSEVLEVASEFDPAHVGVVMDLFHVGNLSEAYERIPEYVDRLALVQIADRNRFKPAVEISGDRQFENRLIPGQGNLLLDRWIDKLNRHGYRGAYELEIHGSGLNKSNYENTLSQSLQYLCGAQRSFNVNRTASEEEKKHRKHSSTERQHQMINIQSRW